MMDHRRRRQVADIMQRRQQLEVNGLRTRRYEVEQRLRNIQESTAELEERITFAEAKLKHWGEGRVAADLASIQAVLLYTQEQHATKKNLSAEERRLEQRVNQLNERLFEARVSEKAFRNIKSTSAKAAQIESDAVEMERSLALWLLTQNWG